MTPDELHRSRIKTAIKEAKRFINRAEHALESSSDGHLEGKRNAAMKRASMDLTRALADVRRSRYEGCYVAQIKSESKGVK